MSYKIIAPVIHGHSRTKTYGAFHAMRTLARKKGIEITTEWDEFPFFLEEMGEKPKGCSVQRIDKSKGYSKENCIWAQGASTNSCNKL